MPPMPQEVYQSVTDEDLRAIAEGMLSLNQGTIYPALLRLEQKGGSRATGSLQASTLNGGRANERRRGAISPNVFSGARALAAKTNLPEAPG